MISTSIKLDGEAEFKKELSGVNNELKNLNSDMKLVTERFKGQANSLEALTAKDKILNEQVEQQTEKVRELEKALEDASDAYGENDKRVDGYYQSLSEARTQLIKMERELSDNSRYMDEARRSADGTAKSIDGFGKEIDQADNSLGDYNKTLSGFIGDLGKIKGAIIGGAAVGAIKELGGAILELEESTREYRQIMGTLATSSTAAGYAAEETAQVYEKLQGVLGDSQTAATATANLQAIGLSQKDLLKITDMAIGAWAMYGDSIPIDGLSEAINETIQAGKVTGTFADVLNWAGESEDVFNEKLEAAKTSTERANLVLEMMASQGLADAANGWYKTNEEIIKANRSEEELRAAWAELGTVLAPVANWIRGTLAGSVIWLTEKVDAALKSLKDLKTWADSASGILDQYGGLGSGGLKNLFSAENLSKTAAELEMEAAAAARGLAVADLGSKSIDGSYGLSDAQIAARQATSSSDSMAGRGSFSATITMKTEDGRNVASWMTQFVNEENAANPQIRSDTF